MSANSYMTERTVAIDFDGVIHSFTSPWGKSTEIPDPPVETAFEAIRGYMAYGFNVAVFSARLSGGKVDSTVAMRDWFLRHGAEDIIKNPKFRLSLEKPIAIIYIDDRGFCFRGEFPKPQWIENFKPWNK